MRVETFKDPLTFWVLVGTYCRDLMISEKLKSGELGPFYFFHLYMLKSYFPGQKKREKNSEKKAS
jgi:hypothetical protein